MSEPTADRDPDAVDTEDLGSLTVEDDPQGTVDPADLAGGADESDSEAALHPDHTEEDLED
jgi:hypothetical protein